MGLFTRKVTSPAFASASIKAAAGASGSGIGQYYTYTVGSAEILSLNVPTISRSRDLLASMVGTLELKHYSRQFNTATGKYDEVYLPTEPWMERPDPKVTRNFIMANTFSDLFFYGRAFWYVTTRYSTGLPASFQWLPAANVSTPDQAGPQFFSPSEEVEFNGVMLDQANVIQFISPLMGLVYQSQRAVNIALHLDQAADRLATLETVPGYLQQKGGETMSGDELSDLAAAWAAARKVNAIGALNDFVEFVEFKNAPGEVLDSQRQYQALELARCANIPPYLVGVPTGGMTYQNAQQARQDLYLFGAKPYLDCIEQTLSMPNILPRNRFVEFNVEDYLIENDMSGAPQETGIPSPQETPA